MSPFFYKKLAAPPQRVCFRLLELRLQKGMTLEEMADKTKIDKKYLLALEKCQFQDFPKAIIYQKNIVRHYAEALGVKSEPFISQYLLEETKKDIIKHPHTAIKNNFWCNLPSFLRLGFVILIVGILFVYLGLQVKNIVEPPKLSILSPQEGYITEKDQLLIVGETEKEASVTVNGKEIKNDEKGQFKEMMYLSPGVNTIVIIAQKKHGKTTTETRHVVYKKAQTTNNSN
jgi:cytoskeletal protein RodZ